MILILITFSICSATTTNTRNFPRSQCTEGPGDNTLANVDISWMWWPLQPSVNFSTNPSGRNFSFPEDSYGNIKINFTVEWRHRLLLRLPIFSTRWTHFEFQIYEGDFPDIEWIYDKHWKLWDPIDK